jgi:AraC-like DNA-binding protein
LERARQFFDEGRHGVADVSRSVGYASVSHFIKGFRSRFGATPGDYADVGGFRCRGRAVP